MIRRSEQSQRQRELLERLARLFDDLVASDGIGRAFGLVDLGSDIEIITRQLDGHPCEVLAGFRAPRDWLAFGIAATGRARPLGGGVVAPVEPGAPVRLVHLVSRSGEAHSRVTPPGAGATTSCPSGGTGPIDDICRLALGMPTAPAPASTIGVWARIWLESVLEIASRSLGRETLGWDRVSALHPAVRTAATRDGDLAEVMASDLVAAGDALARAWPWQKLRRSLAERAAAGDTRITSAQLAWMDDGAFARWLLGCFAEIDDAAEMASSILPASVSKQISHTLSAWGLGRERGRPAEDL